MNLLFITGDQYRAACLGAADHPLVQTPNLDRLAKAGVRFTSHYTSSTPCGPARSCLHTSTYLHANAAYDNGSPMTHGLTNWAKELKQQLGYSPKLIGYVDVVQADLSNPSTAQDPQVLLWDGGSMEGLERLTETDAMGTREWLQQHGLPEEKTEIGWNGYRGDNAWQKRTIQPLPSLSQHATPIKPQAKRAAYSSDMTDTKIMTDRAIQFVQEQQLHPSPWALHLSLLKPHPPWVATEPFVDMYRTEQCQAKIKKVRGERAHEQSVHPWLSAVHGVGATTTKQSHSALGMSDDVLDSLKASYFALVTELDYHLGRLFDALKHSNQWDNTFIVFTADHGEQLGDHFLLGKLGFYDESYHIPLIVRHPRSSANATRGAVLPPSIITEAVDIAPTILMACGMQANDLPEQFQGHSLIQLISSTTSSPPALARLWGKVQRQAAHWEVDWRWWVIEGGSAYPELFQQLCDTYSILPDERWFVVHRTMSWKLVFFPKMPPLLFDMTTSNGENINLATSPRHRDVLNTLLMDLLSWKMRYSGNAGDKKNTRYRIGYDNVLKEMSSSGVVGGRGRGGGGGKIPSNL